MVIRRKEVSVLGKLALINAFGIIIWTCAPFLVCLASFSAFVLVYPNGVLTSDMAFVTLSLFNILQFPVTFIPEMVSLTSQVRDADNNFYLFVYLLFFVWPGKRGSRGVERGGGVKFYLCI